MWEGERERELVFVWIKIVASRMQKFEVENKKKF